MNHISKTLKDNALINLKKKIKVLRGFAKEGIPYVVSDNGETIFDSKTGKKYLDFFPSSLVKFAKWTTEAEKNKRFQNCPWVRLKIGNFTTHSPDTLEKYPKLKAQVVSIIKAVKKKSFEQTLQEQDRNKLQVLISEKDHWKAMAEAEGSKLLEYMDRASNAERKVRGLERALVSAKERLTLIEETNNKTIADLKQRLSQVDRFKSVSIKGNNNE